MSKSKTRLGLLALCATAAMAMMAFAASGAQASAWMLGEENVESNTAVEVPVTKDTLVKLITSSGGTKVEIDCLKQEVTKAELHAGGTADGTVEFTECHTFLEGAESAVCKPTNEPIKAGGKLEITKHEGETLTKATSTSGAFTTLEFGGECSLPEEVEIKGTGWILDCELDPEKLLLTHLIIEGKKAAAALGGLKFGKNPAEIDGSLIIEVLHNEKMVEFSVLG